jgi:hypothetical protein
VPLRRRVSKPASSSGTSPAYRDVPPGNPRPIVSRSRRSGDLHPKLDGSHRATRILKDGAGIVPERVWRGCVLRVPLARWPDRVVLPTTTLKHQIRRHRRRPGEPSRTSRGDAPILPGLAVVDYVPHRLFERRGTDIPSQSAERVTACWNTCSVGDPECDNSRRERLDRGCVANQPALGGMQTLGRTTPITQDAHSACPQGAACRLDAFSTLFGVDDTLKRFWTKLATVK